MKIKVLISVIIPMYNAEKYVDKILNCILSQTYSSFELIIIDDGSNDNTLSKCKFYSRIDNRVRLISQENQGVSVARNKGIEMSLGEYVSFIDADDLVRKDFLEVLYKNAIETNADIVCCECIQTEGNYSLNRMGEFITVKKLV